MVRDVANCKRVTSVGSKEGSHQQVPISCVCHIEDLVFATRDIIMQVRIKQVVVYVPI